MSVVMAVGGLGFILAIVVGVVLGKCARTEEGEFLGYWGAIASYWVVTAVVLNHIG